MSDNSTDVCVIEANPDVVGIGIRASIYTLVLGGRILTYLIDQLAYEKEDAKDFRNAVESALTLQGLALLCTAIYQTVHGQLSLFHAICCLHLLALLGVTIISRNTYRGHGPWRTYSNIAISLLATCAFIAFDSYVWATAPTFGSQPDCNASTRYVVIGIPIQATSDIFRYIIIGAMAVIPAVFIVVITCMAPCWLGCWCHRRRHPDAWITTQGPQLQHNESPGDTKWRKLANVVALTGFSIYAIVSLEQTIDHNDVGDELGKWGFGQVLALFLLLGVVNELFNLGLASMDKRRQDKQKVIGQPTEGEEAEQMITSGQPRPLIVGHV